MNDPKEYFSAEYSTPSGTEAKPEGLKPPETIIDTEKYKTGKPYRIVIRAQVSHD